MASYIARVREGGAIVERTVYGADERTALRQAKRMGDLISMRPAKRSFRSGGMTPNERFQFLNRLATMLRNRVTPETALTIIADVFTGRVKAAAEAALGLVREGADLADVLVADERNFPGSVGLLIKAGAEGGNTPNALREASRFERETGRALQSMMGQVVIAIGYIVTALVMLGVNRFYIIPQMFESGMMEAAAKAQGGELIDVTPYIVMGDVSLIVCVVVTLALTSMFLLATVGRQVAPTWADDIIFRIPLMREIVLTADNYVAFIRLSFLVRAGVRLDESLMSVADATRPGALKEDLKAASKAFHLGKVHNWAGDMRSVHPTDRATLSTSSDARELAETLGDLAEAAKELYLQRLAYLGPIIGGVSLLMVGLASLVMAIVTTVPPMQIMTRMIQ